MMNPSPPPEKRRWPRRLLVVTLLLAIIAAAGWRITFPDPQTASVAGLRRWLVLRDLSQQSDETVLALVDRLQVLLLSEDSTGSIAEATDAQLKRLGANIDILSHAWFLARARYYQTLDRTQGLNYLSEQIDAVLAWGELDDQIQTQLRIANKEPPAASTLRLLDQIDSWVQKEPDNQRKQLENARADAVLVWLATSDLEEYEMSVRRAVVERITVELELGSGDAADRLPLTDAHRAQLLDSAWLLMEAWFQNRADEFVELPFEERAKFMEDQLDKVASWQLEKILATEPGSGLPNGELLTVVTQLLALIPEWIERAPADQQQRLQHLADELRHSLAGYLLRSLPSLLEGNLDP
jgi:hypothetical protein